MPRRFPPPWSVEENDESFAATGQALGYFYFDDVPQRRAHQGRGAADRSQRGGSCLSYFVSKMTLT